MKFVGKTVEVWILDAYATTIGTLVEFLDSGILIAAPNGDESFVPMHRIIKIAEKKTE